MPLNWTPDGRNAMKAETDTHRYQVTYRAFDGGLLHIWKFDDNAPYGRQLLHTCERNSVAQAKRDAEAFADETKG